MIPLLAFVLAAMQQTPKIDSLRLELPTTFDDAYARAATALTDNGLSITNSSPILIEADAGETTNFASGGKNHRIVRVILLKRASSVTVQITGTEVRNYKSQGLLTAVQENSSQLRIDNRAKGNGGKVWRKMVAVAWTLDSTQVPSAAVTGKDNDIVTADTGAAPSSILYGGSKKRKEFFPATCLKQLNRTQPDDFVGFESATDAIGKGFRAVDSTVACET